MLRSTPSRSGHATYRSDVDGLRALAVLAIVAFHLDIPGFPGGFAGVDIFFVISGFVITRGLLRELARGELSLGQFYVRRARRILPALIVVLLLSFAAGLAILSPRELTEFTSSALASLFSVANFYFHDRTNYFAAAAHYRPLLHTWSLSVEEQFYLLFPLFLLFTVGRRRIPAGRVIWAVVIVSFLYCVVAGSISERNAFYMPMARFWEIGVGALVATAEARCVAIRYSAIVGAAGLTAVAVAIALYDGPSTPTWLLAIPVVGTAAVILAGSTKPNLVSRVFAADSLVLIGRFSYSIYLVHWPLIVFWRMCAARPLQGLDRALLLATILVLGAALWRFVERPIRSGGGLANASALKTIAAGAVSVVLFAGVARLDVTELWRLGGTARAVIIQFKEAEAGRPRCVPDYTWLPGVEKKFAACRWSQGGNELGVDFAIWGDSHAQALAPELSQFLLGPGGMKSGISLLRPACPPIRGSPLYGGKTKDRCATHAETVLAALERHKPKLVVLVGRWAILASDVRAPR